MDKEIHYWMIATCLLLIGAGVLAVTTFGVPSGSVIWFGFLLLCPLLHFFMMKGMHHDQHASLHNESKKESNYE